MQAPKSFTAIWWRCKKAARTRSILRTLDFSALGLACAQFISRVVEYRVESHSREPTVGMEIQYSWALKTSSRAFPPRQRLFIARNGKCHRTFAWTWSTGMCVCVREKKRKRGRCWIDRCFPQMGNHTRCLFLWREWKLHALWNSLASHSFAQFFPRKNPSHAKADSNNWCVWLTVWDGK